MSAMFGVVIVVVVYRSLKVNIQMDGGKLLLVSLSLLRCGATTKTMRGSAKQMGDEGLFWPGTTVPGPIDAEYNICFGVWFVRIRCA
jgi:hypothetical protein